ncbi:MAG: type II secretion system F family protein [Actinomycetota bacterium]|nr:type II secretion system F family protein [Actinomycetota bacterium]MDQ3575367.1 type II secretion system F family protein [Actinomycetota bacterium]
MADPASVLAALSAAVAVATAVWLVLPPPRRLAVRITPYAQLSRSRLGAGYADTAVLVPPSAPSGVVADVVGPIGRRLSEGLGRLLDVGDRSGVELRLRQGGFRDTSPEQYRMRQLGWTVGGLTLGAALGLLSGVSAATVLVMAALAGYFGATRWRGRVDRAIGERREAMRSELYTVAQLLAVYIRTGHGPVEAVREVASRGLGPVAAELREAVSWITGGTVPHQAYERLAESTAEPLAARLYRLLGSATTSGGDIAHALLALSDDVRSERRDAVARSAIRRRNAMLLPLLVLIAPTMLLFIAAALPHVIFGR